MLEEVFSYYGDDGFLRGSVPAPVMTMTQHEDVAAVSVSIGYADSPLTQIEVNERELVEMLKEAVNALEQVQTGIEYQA